LVNWPNKPPGDLLLGPGAGEQLVNHRVGQQRPDVLGELRAGTRRLGPASWISSILRSAGGAVLAAVERRIEGLRSATGGAFLRPWEDGRIVRVPVGERPLIDSRSEVEIGKPHTSVKAI